MAAPLTRIKNVKTIYSTCCRIRVNHVKTISVKKDSQGDGKCETEPSTYQKLENDWIGPADKVSNIRKYKYFIPDDESEVEKAFRLKKEETQEWHHQFWTDHNKNFFMLKDEFIKKKMKERDCETKDEDKNITPEELSEFYKKFLDDNYTLHKNYNKEWYKRNISLLWPALKVKFKRMFPKGNAAS